MTWLAWRQFRAQAVTAIAALAAFAVLLAATGPHLASMYAASGITGCHGGSCGQLASSFLSLVGAGIYPAVYLLGIAGIVLAPAVIGIFWGAPLIAREFEAGTFRLAWTQSITRARWLAVKLTLTGLAAMAVTAIAALAAFAVLLALTGPHLASMYAASGIAGCRSQRCGQLASLFLRQVDATSIYPVVYVLGIYAIALVYGLYYAVDWALACDTLPDRSKSAKDMGLFHVAQTLPQTIAPAIGGFLLDYFNHLSPNSGYRAVFASAIVFFVLGTVFVSRIRSVR